MQSNSRTRLLIGVALFGGALLMSWLTHGTGVIKDDPKRSISVPKQLTVPLQVQAAYNGADMYFGNDRLPLVEHRLRQLLAAPQD